MNNRPIIGITMGDPASIGPEIAIKALLHKIFMKYADRC
jgi:4-hydroxy-L-threonine phosphate dehydrogenase PdxA